MRSPKKEKGGFKSSGKFNPPESMRDIKKLLDLIKVKEEKGKR